MKAILLVGHGSRIASSEMLRVAEAVAGREGRGVIVECAYLGLAEPDVSCGIRTCLDRGADIIIIVPYFLQTGAHVASDLPAIVNETARQFREEGKKCSLILARHLGFHEKLADIVIQRAAEAEESGSYDA